MSCDPKLAGEWAQCSAEKNASYNIKYLDLKVAMRLHIDKEARPNIIEPMRNFLNFRIVV